MTIRNTGRRGLFGLLLGAPAAAVAVGAKADPARPTATINVHVPPGVTARAVLRDGETRIDILVDEAEHRMASRLSRGQGALLKAMERSYGLQRAGQ